MTFLNGNKLVIFCRLLISVSFVENCNGSQPTIILANWVKSNAAHPEVMVFDSWPQMAVASLGFTLLMIGFSCSSPMTPDFSWMVVWLFGAHRNLDLDLFSPNEQEIVHGKKKTS